MPIRRALALALALLVLPSWAVAQDAEEPPAEEPTAAEPQAQGSEPAPPATEAPSEPALARPRPPPPIMVVVRPTGRIQDEVTAAASAALVEQLSAMAGRRPVHALAAEAILAALSACREDTCYGGQLASAGAQMGVLLQIRRARGGLSASIEMRDPVSGAPRQEAVTGTLPNDTEGMAEAMAALTAQLEGAMPTRPGPPPSLLVTVNVDDAAVQIDGVDIGRSPLAPVEIAEGEHTISVRAPGYLSVQRRTEVQPGQQSRVDVTLREVGAAPDDGAVAAGDGDNPWAQPEASEELIDQWWFWTAIGGGAALLIGIAIGIGVAVADSGPGAPVQPTGIRLPPIVGGM